MASASYLASRLAQIIPTLMLVVVLVFVLVHLLPGDPALALLGDRATTENIERMRQVMGLDRPVIEQFWIYVAHLAKGDLGQSLLLRVPVSELVIQRLPVTL